MTHKTESEGGILPDSATHIAKLETKLKNLKKNDPNKITGKDILSSMNQFKEIYMQDYFRSQNTNPVNQSGENSIILENVDKSYLIRKLLPEQPISTEEIQILVENDWLIEENSQETENASK